MLNLQCSKHKFCPSIIHITPFSMYQYLFKKYKTPIYQTDNNKKSRQITQKAKPSENNYQDIILPIYVPESNRVCKQEKDDGLISLLSVLCTLNKNAARNVCDKPELDICSVNQCEMNRIGINRDDRCLLIQ